MPSSEHGTGRKRPSSERLLMAGERQVEMNELELGERAAWCMEIEYVGLYVGRDLYRKAQR
jgi:hypothetical protein